MPITVLVGGARSGKSSLAVDIGERFDERRAPSKQAVTFIATAPAFDGDMTDRIARHRAERPGHWTTVEEQIELAAAISDAPTGLVIVDCLTLWTSNLIWADHPDDDIRRLAIATVRAAEEHNGPVVAITNEVGLGIVPENELARRYRDIHGWVNQVWVGSADRALHLIAGKAVPVVDPWTLLGDEF